MRSYTICFTISLVYHHTALKILDTRVHSSQNLNNKRILASNVTTKHKPSTSTNVIYHDLHICFFLLKLMTSTFVHSKILEHSSTI